MKNFKLSSAVFFRGKPNEKIESFAVLHNFMREHLEGYMKSQKSKFIGGTLLILASILILVARQFVLFPHAVAIASGGTLIGATLIILFITAKPKEITGIKKVYVPFSVTKLATEHVQGSVCIGDKKIWNDSMAYNIADEQNITSAVSKLPVSAHQFKNETDTFDILKSIEKVTKTSKAEITLPESSFFKEITHHSKPTENPPNNAIKLHDCSMYINSLSGAINASQKSIDYLQAQNSVITKQTSKYIKNIRKMSENEKNYMVSYYGYYAKRFEDSLEFFNPIEEAFAEDIKDDLSMVERMGERELQRIKDQMSSDQRMVKMIFTQITNQIETEIRAIQRQMKFNNAQDKQVKRTLTSLESARKLASKDLEIAKNELKEVESSKESESAKNSGTLRQLAGGFMIASGTKHHKGKRMALGELMLGHGIASHYHAKSVAEMAKTRNLIKGEAATGRLQHAETIHRQYEERTHEIKDQMTRVKEEMNILRDDIGDIADKMQEQVKNMEDQISKIMESGLQALKVTSNIKSEDFAKVRRNLTKVENMKQVCGNLIMHAQGLMVNEINHHLEPLSERDTKRSEEVKRINSLIEESIEYNTEFIRRVSKSAFSANKNGTYYVPYWLFAYKKKDKIHQIAAYSCLDISKDGAISMRYPELLNNMDIQALDSGLDGIENDFIDTLKESATCFASNANIGRLDRIIYLKGVMNLER